MNGETKTPPRLIASYHVTLPKEFPSREMIFTKTAGHHNRHRHRHRHRHRLREHQLETYSWSPAPGGDNQGNTDKYDHQSDWKLKPFITNYGKEDDQAVMSPESDHQTPIRTRKRNGEKGFKLLRRLHHISGPVTPNTIFKRPRFQGESFMFQPRQHRKTSSPKEHFGGELAGLLVFPNYDQNVESEEMKTQIEEDELLRKAAFQQPFEGKCTVLNYTSITVLFSRQIHI